MSQSSMSSPDKALLDRFAQIIRDRSPPTQVPDIFEGEPEQVLAALAVYRNNVRSSLSRALGQAFPVLKELVGEAFFKFLAHEYYQAHPPTSRRLLAYGDHLPMFLETFDPVAEYPYLPDVARLERLYLHAYHAKDAALIAPDTILAAAGEDVASLVFNFHPSVQFLASDYAVASIWQAHQRATRAPMETIEQAAEHILIARIHMDVRIRVLTRGDYTALLALSLGHTLEVAVGQAVEADELFDPQSFFQTLFQLEIIAGYQQTGK